MKKINYNLCLICLMLTMFVCCDDANDSIGTPELLKVTSTTNFETSLSQCNLGDWIVIHGTNLKDVTSININGVEVNMRDVFLEENKITVQVPRELPDGEATNKIRITRDDFISEVNLNVYIPDLIITGLDNEWAAIGDTVKVNGSNFDLYDVTADNGTVYFGDIAAEITETSADYIKVIVPNGAIKGSQVKIQSENATVFASGLYCDSRNLFEGFEASFGWAGTDNLVTDGTKPGDVAPCNGKYFRVSQVHDGGWYIFIANSYMWPPELWANPEEWCLKFEIFTQIPINDKFIQFDQTKYQWQPWGVIAFDTYGKWKTITLEMTDVLLNGYTQDPNSAFLFQLSLQGGSAETVDFGLDNFRLFHKE